MYQYVNMLYFFFYLLIENKKISYSINKKRRLP